MAGFCGVVVLRTRVRNPWTRHQSITAWVNRVPTPRRHISSATRSRLSSATSSLRRHSRPSGRAGGISANVVGPMTCTVPTIRFSPLSEGTAATQLAEVSCMSLSSKEMLRRSLAQRLSPDGLACWLVYSSPNGLSCPSRVLRCCCHASDSVTGAVGSRRGGSAKPPCPPMVSPSSYAMKVRGPG